MRIYKECQNIKTSSNISPFGKEVQHEHVHGIVERSVEIANHRSVHRLQIRFATFQVVGHETADQSVIFQADEKIDR